MNIPTNILTKDAKFYVYIYSSKFENLKYYNIYRLLNFNSKIVGCWYNHDPVTWESCMGWRFKSQPAQIETECLRFNSFQELEKWYLENFFEHNEI